MAQTVQQYTGNGSTTLYSIPFPYIAQSDIKVRIDGIDTTAFSFANATTLSFNSAPANSSAILIFRQTDDASSPKQFSSGSALKADDLNANFKQNLFINQETVNQAASTLGASFTGNINFGVGNNIVFEGATDDAHETTLTTIDPTADRTVSLPNVTGTLISSGDTGTITNTILAANSVDSSKIIDGSIVNADINASAAIAHSKLATGTLPSGIQVASANIVDGTIVVGDLATGTLDGRYYTETELDAGQLDNRYYTETELNSGQLNNVYYTETELNNGQLNTLYYTETELDAGQLDNRYFTETELTGGALDSRYYTETEAEAKFLRQDSSETIASGVTWSGSDAYVATTAAIDARIVDLVDDVGGFVPIANETSFPAANPDVNNGTGTLVSIKEIGSSRTPSGGTATIANGSGSNTITITGCGSTVLAAGFGAIVETTSTLHTYTFHRLTPKATEITTCAANATSIATAATNVADINNFADLYLIGNTAPTQRADGTSLQNGDLWFDNSSNKVMMVYDGSSGDGFSAVSPDASTITAINTVAGQVTYTEDLGSITGTVNTGSGNNSINTVGANISSVTSTAGSIANVNTVAGSISNVNTVAGSITNVNNVGGSIANVNRYADEYVIQSSTPSSPSSGDLWYNTTANVLNYYNGTSWVGIAAGIAGVINDANPQLGGHLDCNDKNLTEVGTVSGDNLQIDFGTL